MEASKTGNPITWLVSYLREAKEELGKVTWPSRRDTVRYSAIVVGVSVGLAFGIAALDWGLTIGLNYLVAAATK